MQQQGRCTTNEINLAGGSEAPADHAPNSARIRCASRTRSSRRFGAVLAFLSAGLLPGLDPQIASAQVYWNSCRQAGGTQTCITSPFQNLSLFNVIQSDDGGSGTGRSSEQALANYLQRRNANAAPGSSTTYIPVGACQPAGQSGTKVSVSCSIVAISNGVQVGTPISILLEAEYKPLFKVGDPSTYQYGEGETPEAAVDDWIKNVNAYRLANPSGQWTLSPGNTLLYAKDLDRPSVCAGTRYPGTGPIFIGGPCWIHLEVNLNGGQWAASTSINPVAQVNCPQGWGFSGSFAPNWNSLPGFCYSTLPVKNLPADTSSADTCQTTCSPEPKQVGNPIEISIYGKVQQETDYAASRPGGLTIKRTYSSAGINSRVNIGASWRLGVDRSLVEDSNGYVNMMRPGGRVYDFRLINGVYVGDADISITLSKATLPNGQIRWTVRTPDDGIEVYSGGGRLLTASDRYGNTQTLTYDLLDRLATVTDPFGQSMTFGYDSSNRVTTITLLSGEVYRYSYDANNNLTSVTYPDLRTKTYVYGELQHTSNIARPNSLTGIVDERGTRYATFKYFTQNEAYQTYYTPDVNSYFLSRVNSNAVYVNQPSGASRLYTFFTGANQARLLQSVTDQCFSTNCATEARTTYTYDANNNRSSVTDFRNNRTCYAYDLQRNLETTRVEGVSGSTACSTALASSTFTGAARKITTTWHPTLRLPATITEQLGVGGAGGVKVTTHAYDVSGNLTQRQVTTPAGTRTWSWTYDSFGRVLVATDPLGRVSTNTYYPNTATQNALNPNSRGMLASTTNAAGHTTNITAYNAHGQPLSVTDANGLVSTFAYDSRQRLTSRTSGLETTTYEYTPFGAPSKITMPDGSYLSYTYDAAQRLTQIQDGLGNKMVYTLDWAGNRVKEDALDPAGALARTRSRVFDGLSRLQKDIGGLGAAQTTTFSYDANDNQTGVTDPLNRVTTNQYDALNRLIQVNDPLNGAAAPTRYEYDAQDNLTKVTDPKNLATTYTYNGFNELVSQTSPDTGTTSFAYDAAGNMLTKTDARGVVATYSYDVLNRVTAISYPATTSATGNSPAQTITYVYDSCPNGKGRLCSFTDRTGTTAYSYDTQGRVLSKTQTVNGLSQSVAYRYNAAGQMDQMTLPSGKKVALSYTNNRVTGLTVDGQAVVKLAEYEPFGPIGEWTWGNDTPANPNKHTRFFDLDGRNTKIESGVASGAIEPTVIVYDAASRITALQRLTSPTSAVDPARSATYGYDNLDRLTSVTPGAGNTATPQSYTYDAIGNRLSNNVNGAITSYSYGAGSHRLIGLSGATTKSFGFDAAGNRLTDGIQSWIYGGDGRPTAISIAQSSLVSIQAGINALGQRVLKSVNSGQSSSTTRFMYDEAGRLIGEYDLAGRPIQETIWLNDLPVAVLK
jgi:YD repeat-containing protein